MKKNFKTIMSLTVALAISMSGMSMASADNDLTPPQKIGDVVGNSVTVDGDSTTGEFNAVDPIPAYLTIEHLLSATIEFGDMKFKYSFINDQFEDPSFDGENNRLTVTNNSSVPIGVEVSWELNETYNDAAMVEIGFRFNEDNISGAEGSGESVYNTELAYNDDTQEGEVSTKDVYLTVKKDSELEGMKVHDYFDTEIGGITVTFYRV